MRSRKLADNCHAARSEKCLAPMRTYGAHEMPGVTLLQLRAKCEPSNPELSNDEPSNLEPSNLEPSNLEPSNLRTGAARLFSTPRLSRQPQRIEHPLVLAPIGSHLHSQIEKDLRIEKPLELLARGSANGFDHRAALAHHDWLLRFALDDNRAVQTQEPAGHRRLLETIDEDSRRERELRTCVLQHLLANDFGHKKSLRLIRQKVGRIQRLAFRQMRQQ